MEPRSLTRRERTVLDALLGADFQGVEKLRREAAEVVEFPAPDLLDIQPA